MQNKNLKIGILRPSSLGDIVHCMIAIEVIKKYYPASTIEWIIDVNSAPILEYHKDIKPIPIISKGLKKRKIDLLKTIKILKKLPKYDILIDLHGTTKSSIFSFFIKKDIMFGFSKKSLKEKISAIAYDKTFDIDYYQNIYIRNLSLVIQSLDIKENIERLIENKKPFLFFDKEIVKGEVKQLLSHNKKNILLVIGASTKIKIYPVEKLANICKQINENIIVVWGNASELEDAKKLKLLDEKIKISPKTSINELKFLISKMDLVIGNDTGPTHFAFALNKPSITLFGNTPNKRIVYETQINKSLTSPSKVDAMKIDKNDFSIKDILEQDILNLANELLFKQ